MSLLAILENGLFALGQVLRFPVMALLWVCVVAAIFIAGRTVADFVIRRRERARFDIDAWLDGGDALGAGAARSAALPADLRALLLAIERARSERRLARGGLDHLVIKAEERAHAELGISRLLVKAGPSLGLLGTLIPMGTALAALSSGNLQAMAGQMVVAFTTTIIGLACGVVAFVVVAVRQHWVAETVREQRYLAEQAALEIEREGEAEAANHGESEAAAHG